MPRVSEQLRHAAHDAWIEANKDRRRAIQLLRQHPEGAALARPGRFIMKWGAGFQQRRTYADAPRSGRPRLVQPADVKRAAEILVAGYDFNGIQRGYGSFQHALEESEELKQILQRSGVKSAHLLRCIKCVHPEIVFRVQPVKPAFNLKQKKARVRDSKRLMKRSDRWRQEMFWVDAKKMHIKATPRLAWLDKTQLTATVPDSRTDGRVTLHFYAMVNAKGGPVALKYVTGTTGLQSDAQYLVSPFIAITCHA